MRNTVYQQAYAKFGADPQIAKLGTSKVLKLLPLPGEQLEQLFSENDVKSMSTRQLDEAIRNQKEKLLKEAREEVREELEREKNLRIAAEKTASIVKEKLKQSEEEHTHNFETITNDRKALMDRNRKLEQEIRERDELLQEQQEDFDRMQAELLNAKSNIAKGDAERVPSDRLTSDIFASAVRTFIGAVARMPHMSAAFSTMNHEEKADYDELLQVVENWAKESRKALDMTVIESEVII